MGQDFECPGVDRSDTLFAETPPRYGQCGAVDLAIDSAFNDIRLSITLTAASARALGEWLLSVTETR